MLGRLIVTIFCAAISSAIAAFAPGLFNITKSLPVLSLCTAQLALVFIFILLAFPKAGYPELMRLSRYYVAFLVLNFSALTFFSVPHKLFAFGEIVDTVTWLPFPFPELVSTNVTSLITINILSFLYLAILPQKPSDTVKVPEGHMPSSKPVNIEEDLIIHAPNDLEFVGDISKASEVKIPEITKAEQVGVLEEVLAARSSERQSTSTAEETLSPEQIAFLEQIGANAELSPEQNDFLQQISTTTNLSSEQNDFLQQIGASTAPAPTSSGQKTYDQDPKLSSVYASGQEYEAATKEKLEQLEQALLNNIDFKIDEALCINTNGQSLEETMFHWHSADKQSLMQVFKRFDDYAQKTEMGALCQLAFKQGKSWYMISKYQGSYLVLKTSHTDPSPVLETTYRVLTHL